MKNGGSMLGSSLKRRNGMTESRRFVRYQARGTNHTSPCTRHACSAGRGRVDCQISERYNLRNKSATNIQRIARGMLGRLYVEDYRIANTRQMTDEEAAIKVQAGLRAMWARKYVDILRTYERTMKTMKEEEDKKPKERGRKKGQKCMVVCSLSKAQALI